MGWSVELLLIKNMFALVFTHLVILKDIFGGLKGQLPEDEIKRK